MVFLCGLGVLFRNVRKSRFSAVYGFSGVLRCMHTFLNSSVKRLLYLRSRRTKKHEFFLDYF